MEIKADGIEEMVGVLLELGLTNEDATHHATQIASAMVHDLLWGIGWTKIGIEKYFSGGV